MLPSLPTVRAAAPHTRRRLSVLLSLVVLGACTETVTPVEEVRVPVDQPPASFSALWAEVESCSARSGSFDRVRWFTTSTFPGDPFLLGQWSERHEITLRDDVWRDPFVVKHEMLHDLLDGDPEHEDWSWILCGLPIGGD